MNSGASEILPMVAAILAQSSSPIWPLRSFCRCTRASAESRRMVISLRLISSEKTTDVMLCLIDADRAMSMPMVELCVGIIERPARYRCVACSISTQRTGTLSIGSTDTMNRWVRRAVDGRRRSLCTSRLRSRPNTSSSVVKVSV